jgi:hypothetical protein
MYRKDEMMANQDQRTFLTSVLEATEGYESRLDTVTKLLVSTRPILARILKGAIPEYADCSIEEVQSCIEGRVHVSVNAANLPERIVGSSTENIQLEAGTAFFDIRFYALLPGRADMIQVIVNVEIQRRYNPGYDLTERGIFYCARQLADEKDRDFSGNHYADLKKVYSIWLCLEPDQPEENSIIRYRMQEQVLYGHSSGRHRYDLMEMVMVTLNKSASYEDGTELHRMLNILFSATLSAADKTRMLQEDYDIPANREIEEGVERMCNYSSYVKDQGISRGKIEDILELLEVVGLIPNDLQVRIEQETDLSVLKNWLQLAAKANNIEEFRKKAGI